MHTPNESALLPDARWKDRTARTAPGGCRRGRGFTPHVSRFTFHVSRFTFWPCLACLLLATGAHAAGLAVKVVAPQDVGVGSTVQVRIDLSGAANLGGLFFDVDYDPMSATLAGVSATGQLASQGLFASNPDAFPSSTGRLRFGFLHAQGLSQQGTLVTLSFLLSDNAPSPVLLTASDASALAAAGTALPASATNGSIGILLASAGLASGLRLFSVPASLTNPDPAALLGDQPANVRLAAYSPTTAAYASYNGTTPVLEIGKGYWLRTSASKLLRARQGRLADHGQAYAIALARGWNLIGNPFRQAVPWSLTGFKVRRSGVEKTLAQARQAGWIDDFAWAWVPASASYRLVYDPTVATGLVGKIDPWQGYWVKTNAACELVVPPPSAGTSPVRSRGAGGWSARLLVHSGSEAAEVTVGLVQAGRALAVGIPPDPPSGQTALRAALLRNDEPLAVDLREGLGQRQEWDLSVALPDQPAGGEATREATITWPDLRALPRDTSLFLVDPATNTRRYLRTTAAYTCRLEGGSRRLRIVAEPRTGALIAITGLDVVSSGRGTSRTVRFTLSAAATVEIEAVSPTGRRVASIARGRASEAGQNEVFWSQAVAPGIYMLRVTATTDEGATVQAVRPCVGAR